VQTKIVESKITSQLLNVIHWKDFKNWEEIYTKNFTCFVK